MDYLMRLRCMAGCAMFGCALAGSFGHHEDNVQWATIVAASWIGGLIEPTKRPGESNNV